MSQQTLPFTPPPQKKTIEGGFTFSYRCLVFPQKNVLKVKPVLFGVKQIKTLKNVFFQHIHSSQILINLKMLDTHHSKGFAKGNTIHYILKLKCCKVVIKNLFKSIFFTFLFQVFL